MLEAICGKCGETFNPVDENDLIHGESLKGPCGGKGKLTGQWFFTPEW